VSRTGPPAFIAVPVTRIAVAGRLLHSSEAFMRVDPVTALRAA
jgi:hypothetical protein